MAQWEDQPAPDVVNNLTTDDATKALSAAQGKALNTQIAKYDSVTITGDTAKGSLNNASYCRRTYREVTLLVSFTYTASTASGWQAIASIPSTHKPEKDLYFVGWDDTGGNASFAYVSSNGAIGIKNPTQNHAYLLFITFMANSAS